MAGVLNAAFQVVVARTIPIEHYSGFAVLMALIAVAAVATGSWQTALSGALRNSGNNDGYATGGLGVRSGAGGLVLGGLVVAASPALTHLLNLPGPLPTAAIGVWVAVALWGATAKAAILAAGNLSGFVVVNISTALSRLLLAAWAAHNFGITGAICAVIIGEIIGSGAAWIIAARSSNGLSDLEIPWADTAVAGLAQGGFWTFIAVWMVVARSSLGPAEASMFAASVTASTAAVFLPQGLAGSAYPHLVGAGWRRALRSVTVTAGGLAVAQVVGLALLGPTLIPAAFGGGYAPSRTITVALGAAGALCGVGVAFLYTHIARRSIHAAWPWVGAATIAVVGTTAGTPEQLAVAIAAVAAATVAALGFFALKTPRVASGHPVGKLDRKAQVDVTVVVPAYNAGVALAHHVSDVVDVLDRHYRRSEVIVVDDGSTDGSVKRLASAPPVRENVQLAVHTLNENCGKGAAVAAGMSLSRGQIVAFIDADGDISASHLPELILAAETSWAAIGTKVADGADNQSGVVRKVTSAGWRWLVRALYALDVDDTQVGAKAFRRETLAAALGHCRQNRFAFDIELLAVAAQQHPRQKIATVPVTISREGGSTVGGRTVVAMLAQAFAVWVDLAPQRQALQATSQTNVDGSRPHGSERHDFSTHRVSEADDYEFAVRDFGGAAAL